MGEILARKLIDKSIIGTDGTNFGTLANVTMGVESAALRNLVVDPNDDLSLQSVAFERNEEGRLLIPIDHISTLNDQIVVHR